MLFSIQDHTQRYRPPTGFLDPLATALEHQANHDFGPSWGTHRVTVNVGGRGMPLHVFDDADQAGALGYHDVDASGRPYARIFAGPSIESGSTWGSGPYAIATTFSHELLEMIGDLDANLMAWDGKRRNYAREACDPVEATSYEVYGIPVSNFVTPAWFVPGSAGPWDRLHVLEGPLTLDKGGYAIIQAAGAEGQLTAEVLRDDVPEWRMQAKLDALSRTAWRLIAMTDWTPPPAKAPAAKKAAPKPKPVTEE